VLLHLAVAVDEEIKKCLECDIEIEGRIDKKFCSDYCRNVYNNNQNRDANKYVRNINNRLRKNRKILEHFCPEGKGVVHKDELLLEGFNFDYFTNIYRTKTGSKYFFCYDYGYISLEDEKFAIVKRGDYIK